MYLRLIACIAVAAMALSMTNCTPILGRQHRVFTLSSSAVWLLDNCHKSYETKMLNTFSPHSTQIWECIHFPKFVRVVNCTYFGTRCYDPHTKRYLNGSHYRIETKTSKVTLVNPNPGCDHLTLTLPTKCVCKSRHY